MGSFLNMRVRLANLRDCDAITRVHCSGITRWYRHVNGGEIEDAYENLSLWDRYLIGGPWMSPETCAIHLNNMLLAGQFPLVAEMNGKIVGEIEVFIGEEPPPLGKNACISVLEVDKNHRGRGVGKALVKAAVKLAEEHQCNVITVIPEENTIEFYRKCGLNEVLINLKHVEIDLEKFRKPTDVKVELAELKSFETLKQKHMVYGRYDNSYAQWLKRRWRFSIWPSQLLHEEGFIPSNAAYILESHPLKKATCTLLAWTESPRSSAQLLKVCANRAGKLGFTKLETTVSETADTIKRIPFTTLDSEITLGKRLQNIKSFERFC